MMEMSDPKKPKLNENERESNIVHAMTQSEKLFNIQNEMCAKLKSLNIEAPVKYIYNPLDYAKNLHETFVKKFFENSTKKILFLGMNPGPWGMCQTGISFGEKNYVQNWLKITGLVNKPENEHPKKKVMGLDCNRSEISGKKFWEFFKKLCGTPENFFKHSFIYNHCPLAFVDEYGKNITPPEIKNVVVRKQLISICNEAFIRVVKEFNFEFIIGIGKFAEKCALDSLRANRIENVEVLCIPHPSPRNAKNKLNWEKITTDNLKQYNLLQYFTDRQEETTSPYFITKIE